MFSFKWLRKLVRSNTKPIPADRAELWKFRLSMAYVFLGFNIMGALIIATFKGKLDWADYYGIKSEEERSLSPSQQWALTLGKNHAQHYRLSGFTLKRLEDTVPPAFDENESLNEKILDSKQSDYKLD